MVETDEGALIRRRPSQEAEQGAILVHVLIGIIAFMAFSTFVVDYGAFWLSRRQAQNSADSGALAGANGLAFDDYDDRTVTGAASESAFLATQANGVFGQVPSVIPASDITFPPCPDDNTNACIRVDTYRTAARGNALPTFFGLFIGMNGQDVRATATAKVADANTAVCVKPWAIADKWIENNPVIGGTWSPTSTFDPTGPNPDVYVPATADDPGSGFTVEDDYGTELVLKVGSPQDSINPGWFAPIRLPGYSDVAESESKGGDDYREAINSCRGGPVTIGMELHKENGNMIGPTKQGVDDLVALDPYATWDGQKVVGGCMATGSCAQSPRIVPVPVFDLADYLAGETTGNATVRIVNVLGFFVLGMQGNDVRGILMTAPGMMLGTGPGIDPEAAFLQTVVLVR